MSANFAVCESKERNSPFCDERYNPRNLLYDTESWPIFPRLLRSSRSKQNLGGQDTRYPRKNAII
jgi:hypothetical protein